MPFQKYKNLIVIIFVLVLFLGVTILIVRWPFKEYKGLGMRPNWDVADNLVKATNNKSYATAVYNLGYTTFLHEHGPFTVFVPVDSSYDKIPTETKRYLADQKNQGSVRQLVLYHIVKGKYLTKDLKDNMKLTTVQGEPIIIKRVNGLIVINGRAFLQTSDIEATNGVIHTIDTFLFPPTMYTLQEPFTQP